MPPDPASHCPLGLEFSPGRVVCLGVRSDQRRLSPFTALGELAPEKVKPKWRRETKSRWVLKLNASSVLPGTVSSQPALWPGHWPFPGSPAQGEAAKKPWGKPVVSLPGRYCGWEGAERERYRTGSIIQHMPQAHHSFSLFLWTYTREGRHSWSVSRLLSGEPQGLQNASQLCIWGSPSHRMELAFEM